VPNVTPGLRPERREGSSLLRVFVVSVGACYLGAGLAWSAGIAGSAWDQWRGPGRDGKIAGFSAPGRWPKQLTRRWKVEVGAGHSSPLAVGDGVFVFTREGDDEVIRRLDLTSGREVWKNRCPVPYEMNAAASAHGKGPKSTPLYRDGLLYTLGISGILSCHDARSGRVRWRHDFAREFKTTSPLYGTVMSPVAADGSVIAHVGGHDDGALTAFDAKTGRVRWRWAGDGPAYASPIVVNLAGVRQVVTQTQKMCVGVALSTGKLLWSLPFKTPYDQNCVTPVAAGETLVFGGTHQPTFACRVHRNGAAWTAEKVWEAREVTLYMSTPVAVGSRLFGMSERRQGQLFCLDAATGKLEWTGPARFGENAAIFAAGQVDHGAAPARASESPLLLALTTGADLCVFQRNGATLTETARYHVADSPTWASPAIPGNRIVVKDAATLTLWEIPSGGASAWR
jgi:outer membrane protein assembly factor BamB